jgi:hypothetical protein
MMFEIQISKSRHNGRESRNGGLIIRPSKCGVANAFAIFQGPKGAFKGVGIVSSLF